MAKQLLPQADIEIIEKHHRYKDDAPSGTAKALLDALCDEDTTLCYGREGNNTRRKSGEIGVHAVRGGTVCGDHEVIFFLNDEIVTLTHHAQSRAIFASGALKAAGFIIGQTPGIYGMDEMMK
jgi:4-hydroxy-tetrahydrodipicolinate reductase